MASIISKIEDNKKKRILKQIAKSEFEQARGTYHLHMLNEARKRYELIIKDIDRDILQKNDQKLKTEIEEKEQLRQCLEKYLITTRITEIPGIGQELGRGILNQIYRGNLTDLYQSFALSGIGDQKQSNINIWVNKYLNQIFTFLQNDFPGKNEIINQSKEKIVFILDEIEQKHTDKSVAEKKLIIINQWIGKLEKITLDDFIAARVENKGNFSEIENYINGVFAEWESIPDWFKEVMSGGIDVQ